MLGLPFYARGWKTSSSDVYQFLKGQFTPIGSWEKGSADYKDLVNVINSNRSAWTLIWDEQAKATMAFGVYKNQQTVWTYDDMRTMCEKMKFANKNNLAGVFAWESSGDNGSLLNVISNGIGNDSLDCSSYSNDDYDVIFKNTIHNYEGGSKDAASPAGISGEVHLEKETTEGTTTEGDTTKPTIPDYSNLPSDEDLKKDAIALFRALSPKDKAAVEHLMSLLEFDESALIDSRSISRDAKNVDMVKSVISEETYNQLFPLQHKFYSYEVFIRSVQAFPRLCGEEGETQTQCKEELAAIFANFVQETGANSPDTQSIGRNLDEIYILNNNNHPSLAGGELSRVNAPESIEAAINRAKKLNLEYSIAGVKNSEPTSATQLNTVKFHIPLWRQGLFAVAEGNCRSTDGDFNENACTPYRDSCLHEHFGAVWKCPSDTKYYGRGAHQLTHIYNYGRFGSFLWGSENRQKLVDNPNYIIDEEPILAMMSATWFHMYSTGRKPSMHDIALKVWKPGSNDIAGNRGQTFGTMINVINGSVECGKVTRQATERGQRYMAFRKYLGLPPVDNDFVRCDNQTPYSDTFTNSGAGPIYYAKGDKFATCKLVSWERGFSIYDKDNSGYVECVKFHYGKK
jgi:hypothetical protein